MFPYTSPANVEGAANATSTTAPKKASKIIRRFRAAKSGLGRLDGSCGPRLLLAAWGGAERAKQVRVDEVDLDFADATVQVAHQAPSGAELPHECDQLPCRFKTDEPQRRRGARIESCPKRKTTPIRSDRSPRSSTLG